MTSRAQKKISATRRIVGALTALFLIAVLMEIAVGNVRAFQVVSRSMEPTLKVGDCVLSVRELTTNNLCGKIIAFQPKEPGDALVKRVVAQDGQTVEIRNGYLFVEGAREHYSDQEIERARSAKMKVDKGLFVVGDNRNNSYDSIDHGPIGRDQVLGVIAFRYWPPDRIGVVR